MQPTSEIYNELFRNPYHEKETRVFVAGIEYGKGQIVSLKTCSDLYADDCPGVGGTTSKEIELILRQPGDIPRTAEIRPEVRLVLRDWATDELLQTSEWIPKGVFYTDTRSESYGDLTIQGYDAMLKLEELYIPADADLTNIPDTMDTMAVDIATRIGVTIDDRTQLNAYPVSPPVGYTMREVMGFIAAAHAGNWAMTDTGKLRLVPLAGIPAETGCLVTEDGDAILLGDVRLIVSDSDTAGKGGDETFVGLRAASLTPGKPLEPYTGVILWWDDENAYRSGDESGRVLEADCIWATQAMADAVMASVSGFAYKPYAATGTILDPAAELGDGVTVGGVYSVLASVSTTYDAMTASDIAAPSEDEVDSEYPYQSPEQRELQRKVTLGKAYYGTRITRQNGLEVVKTSADGTETSLVRLNSEVLAFYNADGQEALYFDAAAGKYRFRGDVTITGGSMNIGDNFIVDEDGNLTLNGTINLSGGAITWGDNAPVKSQFSPDGSTDWSDTQRTTDKYRRDWDYSTGAWGVVYQFIGTDGEQGAPGKDATDESILAYLESIGITEITQESVKAPKIEGGEIYGAEIYGAEIYGGVFSDLESENFLRMRSDFDFSDSSNWSMVHVLEHLVETVDQNVAITQMGYVGAPSISAWVLMVLGNIVLYRDSSSGTTKALGKWDFSGATVTGI